MSINILGVKDPPALGLVYSLLSIFHSKICSHSNYKFSNSFTIAIGYLKARSQVAQDNLEIDNI